MFVELFATCVFQFHEGPIKTVFGYGNGVGNVMFQFHEGPIKTKTKKDH